MNLKYKQQKFVRLKVGLSIVFILLIISEIILTSNMIYRLSHEYRPVKVEELADVQINDMIKGSFSKSDVVLYFKADLETGGRIYCSLVRSKDNKLLLLEALDCYAPQSVSRMDQIMDHPELSMDYQGTVGGMTQQISIPLNLSLVMHNTFREYGLKEDDLMQLYVRLSDPEDIDYLLYIIAGIGIGLSLTAGVIALLWKSANNIIYGIMVQKGYIAPELKVTKEDLLIEDFGEYGGMRPEDNNSFYVETEFNIRGEGETELTLQRKQVDKVELDAEGNLVRPVRKERSENDNIEFYQSGVSEEGNFYISEETDPYESIDGVDDDEEDNDNRRLRY